jgi:uncharacterized protein (DUF2345 family)
MEVSVIAQGQLIVYIRSPANIQASTGQELQEAVFIPGLGTIY